MNRLSFLGIIVSIFILAAPGQVSAGVDKSSPSPPDNLTDTQEAEWKIGTYSGWLRLCGYGSKASHISTIMKKSPYFRNGESQMSKYDSSMRCSSTDEGLNQFLGQKEQWIQYLNVTYP